MISNKLLCMDGEIQYEGVKWRLAANALKINTFKLQEITVSRSLECVLQNIMCPISWVIPLSVTISCFPLLAHDVNVAGA